MILMIYRLRFKKQLNFFDKLSTKLQEHNSSRVNSQKENKMQLVTVKHASKPTMVNKAISKNLLKQSENLNAKAEKGTDAVKAVSFNRFLEAYGDCV